MPANGYHTDTQKLRAVKKSIKKFLVSTWIVYILQINYCKTLMDTIIESSLKILLTQKILHLLRS